MPQVFKKKEVIAFCVNIKELKYEILILTYQVYF